VPGGVQGTGAFWCAGDLGTGDRRNAAKSGLAAWAPVGDPALGVAALIRGTDRCAAGRLRGQWAKLPGLNCRHLPDRRRGFVTDGDGSMVVRPAISAQLDGKPRAAVTENSVTEAGVMRRWPSSGLWCSAGIFSGAEAFACGFRVPAACGDEHHEPRHSQCARLELNFGGLVGASSMTAWRRSLYVTPRLFSTLAARPSQLVRQPMARWPVPT